MTGMFFLWEEKKPEMDNFPRNWTGGLKTTQVRLHFIEHLNKLTGRIKKRQIFACKGHFEENYNHVDYNTINTDK